MKKIIKFICLLKLALCASTSMVYSTVLFSSIDAPSGYSAFGPATGLIGQEDYVTNQLSPTMTLTSMRFVGGVDTASSAMLFEFFDTANTTLQESFSVTLPSAGNFIWTITLGGGGVDIPTDGVLRLTVVDPLVLGQWFLTPDAPTIGSSPQSLTAAGFNHSFELDAVVIPEPSSAVMVLIGLAGLISRRRRG